MSKTFQDEQNELLTFLIENKFFKRWRGDTPYNTRDIYDTPSVEFIITSACNKNCEYCYLARFGDDLYPKEYRDQETILKNLSVMLDYFKDNHFRIPKFDFFSGEIWHTDFGIKVLITLLAKIKSGLIVEYVMIPSNFTFIRDEEKTKQIDFIIDEYRKVGTELAFSASIDGKYCEDLTRPFNNESTLDEEYYDRLFKFCKKHEFGLHPMMSAFGIEAFKKNFTWFMDKLKEYEFITPDANPLDIYRYIMFLEVRNEDWTEDKIKKYLDALNYCCDHDIDNIYSKMDKGFDYLLSRMLEIPVPDEYKDSYTNYINYFICGNSGLPGCTISYTLMIRAGDLAIAPCHRTSYEKFLYGHFTQKDGKITGIEAQNPVLANRIWNQKMKAQPFCDSCYLYNHCMRGCYGSQYETNGDLFYPNEGCCDLFKTKVMFIYFKAKQIIEKYNLDKEQWVNPVLDSVINCIKEENEEKYNKWKQYIQQVMS